MSSPAGNNFLGINSPGKIIIMYVEPYIAHLGIIQAAIVCPELYLVDVFKTPSQTRLQWCELALRHQLPPCCSVSTRPPYCDPIIIIMGYQSGTSNHHASFQMNGALIWRQECPAHVASTFCVCVCVCVSLGCRGWSLWRDMGTQSRWSWCILNLLAPIVSVGH